MDKRIIFITSIILSIGALFVLPVDDDFYYLTAPHKDFLAQNLLPNGPFWRPFDVLFGLFMGKFSFLFPFLNHILVLIGYAYAIYGLNHILNYCYISKTSQFISLAIFGLSPALVATTYSVDSSNQSISLALGIASLLYYDKHKFPAYLLMILSVFAKESGIAWFAITPLLNVLMQKLHGKTYQPMSLMDYKKLIKPWCISLFIIAIYAIARITLSTHIASPADASSRYSSGIGMNSLLGLGMILASATTAIDTIALFLEKNWTILAISILVSSMIIILYLKKIKWQKSKILLLAICILAISSPHLVMKHPAEMHVYPTLWMLALSIGILTSEAEWTKKDYAIIYMYSIVSILVFAHKGYYIYSIGKIADTRIKSAVTQSRKIPNRVLILDCDPQQKTYSVFQTDGMTCWDKGKGTRLYFGLKNPEYVEYKVIKSEQLKNQLKTYDNKIKGKYDACWIVRNNKVKVIE